MSSPLKDNDPAQLLLQNPQIVSQPSPVYSSTCYICNDKEFEQLGMSLCRACIDCGGHIPADDVCCDDCGKSTEYDLYLESLHMDDSTYEVDDSDVAPF